MSDRELHALLSGPPEDAARWILAAAQQGLAEAQNRLGRMLLDGTGMPADPARAVGWFKTAARGHDADAMNMLGRCYENGWGVAADPVEATEWYRKSAERGDAWGQYNFGHRLLDGAGIAQDRAWALHWYLKASEQGHSRAMNMAARCYEEGWGAARDLGHRRRMVSEIRRGRLFSGAVQLRHGPRPAGPSRRGRRLVPRCGRSRHAGDAAGRGREARAKPGSDVAGRGRARPLSPSGPRLRRIAALDRESDQLRSVRDAEPRFQQAQGVRHGFVADADRLGHFREAAAFGQQPQQFRIPRG